MNQRFILNEREEIIDKLNPGGDPIPYEGDFEDDKRLRELVFQARLRELMGRLFGPSKFYFYRKICLAFEMVIHASHLNTLDPALAIQNRFDGTLKRKKRGLSDFTSLSLFIDDVERLLRDLYGDVEGEAIERGRYSLWSILKSFVGVVLGDSVECNVRDGFCMEYDIAIEYDEASGFIEPPEGYPHYPIDDELMENVCSLADRVSEVLKNPSAFSEYTVEFAKYFAGRFKKVDEVDDDTKSTDTPAVIAGAAAN